MDIIQTLDAPQAIGPYSQAIRVNGFVYSAGQVGLNPTTGQLAGDDIETQTRQALANLKAVLEAAGTSLSNAVKTTVFLADMNEFTKMNEIYAQAFGTHRPARSTVQVARLPRDAK